MELPEPPQFDSVTQQIVQVFILASRARRYVEAQPLPLTVRDITDVVEAHPIDMPREMLDYIIFALDDKERSEQSQKNTTEH